MARELRGEGLGGCHPRLFFLLRVFICFRGKTVHLERKTERVCRRDLVRGEVPESAIRFGWTF